MTQLAKHALLAWAIGVALCGVAAAQLDPNLTPAEFACEQAVGKSGSKYFRAFLKCSIKCERGFFGGLNPSTDCYAPFGGAMAACLNDPLKGADAKFRAAIEKACDPATKPGRNCPECYDAAGGGLGCGAAGFASAHQHAMRGELVTYPPGIFCKTTGASKGEQKCQQSTAKVAAKLVAAVYKCFGGCFAKASESLVAGSDCAPNPVLPNDVATQTCIGLAQSKSTPAFDRRCATAGVSLLCPPVCSGSTDCDSSPGSADGVCTNNNCSAGNTTTTAYPPGANWSVLVTVASVGNIVDSPLGVDTGIYCSQ